MQMTWANLPDLVSSVHSSKLDGISVCLVALPCPYNEGLEFEVFALVSTTTG